MYIYIYIYIYIYNNNNNTFILMPLLTVSKGRNIYSA